MSERTIIPTFVFWAFLTIITPTLILLSENSKADIDLNGGNITDTMKVRRMNGHAQNNNIRTAPPPVAAKLVVEEELAPAPLPTQSHLHYNHTDLISNNCNSTFHHDDADDASKVQVQQKYDN